MAASPCPFQGSRAPIVPTGPQPRLSTLHARHLAVAPRTTPPHLRGPPGPPSVSQSPCASPHRRPLPPQSPPYLPTLPTHPYLLIQNAAGRAGRSGYPGQVTTDVRITPISSRDLSDRGDRCPGGRQEARRHAFLGECLFTPIHELLLLSVSLCRDIRGGFARRRGSAPLRFA